MSCYHKTSNLLTPHHTETYQKSKNHPYNPKKPFQLHSTLIFPLNHIKISLPSKNLSRKKNFLHTNSPNYSYQTNFDNLTPKKIQNFEREKKSYLTITTPTILCNAYFFLKFVIKPIGFRLIIPILRAVKLPFLICGDNCEEISLRLLGDDTIFS